MPLVIFALLVLIATVGRAQEPVFQVDWVPDNFFVVCDKEDQCPLNRERSQRVADMMSEVVNGMKKMPFDAPKDWGLRVGNGTANDYIELYQRSQALASASPRCGNPGKPGASIQVGAKMFRPGIGEHDYLIHYFMAHEVFHLIQYNYPFYDQQICDQYVPGWIKEGTAVAVGLEAMHRRYPSSWPSTRNEREARNFAGLRRYDEPLPHRQRSYQGDEMFSGDHPQYWTSSFWQHIARAYHRGSYEYLHRYLSRAGKVGDWVPWLRNNIEDDLLVDLGLVFSGFLADYAGWGDPGYPGAFFGRRKWLDGAFGGCEQVNLDRKKAHDWVELEILPLAGNCVEVRISTLGEHGLRDGDSAAVQIAGLVMAGPKDARNGLHLSLAASNEKGRFHCAKEARQGRKIGIGKCMMYPDDGELRLVGAPVEARVWNVRAQEPGNAPVIALTGGDQAERRQEKGGRSGELVNLYTVSYTPENVSTADTIYGGRNPVTARIYFVLDVARLDIGGPVKKAVGSIGQGGDPQTTVPKRDATGAPANSYSLPESLRPQAAFSPITVPAHVLGKLSSFNVTAGADGPAEQAGVWLYPVSEDSRGKLEHRPLSIGDSGAFLLGAAGNLGGEPLVHTGPGSLQVEEFTDLVFRADYRISLCRLRGWDPNKDCPEPIPVSGSIVKAFAGTRLPGHHMRIERTRGTEMYRKANEQGLASWFEPNVTGDDAGPGDPGPDVDPDSGAILSDCACTCEEREEILRQGEALKARQKAGEAVSAEAVMGLMRCQSQCQAAYMKCEMERNRLKKDREEKERAAQMEKLKGACDCSCEGLKALQGRSESILREMQAGSPAAMTELQQLGECMSVCQSELMNCAGVLQQ